MDQSREEPQEIQPDDESMKITDPSQGDDVQDVAELQRQCDDFESKWLRAMADLQNYRRRAEQNVVAARQQQTLDLAKALVVVLDHFDRALEVDPDKTPAASMLHGVQIVRDELMRTLERFGVQRIDVQMGDEFDPARHAALMRQKIEGVESNHVTMQMQPGYALGDMVVRPAQVAVAE